MSEQTTSEARLAKPGHDPGVPDQDLPWDFTGLRRFILGSVIAVLGPLGGFLGGSMVGRSDDGALDPLFAWMFVGLAIGAAGAFLAFFGGTRWLAANRRHL